MLLMMFPNGVSGVSIELGVNSNGDDKFSRYLVPSRRTN